MGNIDRPGMAEQVMLLRPGTERRHGGYRVPHDRGAVTVGNEAPVWQDRCPAGQSRLLRKRIVPWAKRMGAEATTLRVLPLGYRWGSCTPDGKVNIHWATMQLPPDLVDYVLVHELAHLRHPDHGPRFWRAVERAMPDAQARRDRLRHLGPDLWLPEAD